MTNLANPIEMSKKQTCTHDDIEYFDLLQIEGEPHYIVLCTKCRKWGTIRLIEGANTFGMSDKDVDELRKECSHTYNGMPIKLIISQKLIDICVKVQSGEYGTPTVEDLNTLGKIHAIIGDASLSNKPS